MTREGLREGEVSDAGQQQRRSKRQRVARFDASRGDRPAGSPPHLGIKGVFHPLIQGRGSARDEQGAEHRVQE
jgi:hypothetical protein